MSSEPIYKATACALQQGEVLDKVEGADAAALTQAVQQHFSQASTSRPQAAASDPTSRIPANGAATTPASSVERIKKLMNRQPVMLFMKVGHVTVPLVFSLVFSTQDTVMHVNPMTSMFVVAGVTRCASLRLQQEGGGCAQV